MPTRIIREGILTSEVVNSLSEPAELFYRRLMQVADDYGRYWSDPEILRANCFQHRLKSVSVEDVSRRLAECLRVGLIVIYGSGKYLLIEKFGQQTRSRSKFPEPTVDELLIKCKSSDIHLLSTVGVEGVVVVDKNKSAREQALIAASERSPIDVYTGMLGKICQLFSRPQNQLLNYHESAALAEICRRENAESELTALEQFKTVDPGYFPKSLESLLRKWDATLDRARNYGNNPKPGEKPNPRNAGIGLDPAQQSAAIVATLKRRELERKNRTHE